MNLTVAVGGIHPTTESCIEALVWLHERAGCKNILEIGSGSGVLSVIAAKIWQAPVLAVDMVEKAVEATTQLARENQLESLITAIRSEGFRHQSIAQKAPYDLIICNLVAQTIIALTADIKKSLAPDGYVLVSGVLQWLAEDVEAVFKSVKLEIMYKNSHMSWNSYILRHASDD